MPGGGRGGIHDRPAPEEVTEAYTTPGGINPLLIHSLSPEKMFVALGTNGLQGRWAR